MDKRECRILCPVCPEDQLSLRTYDNLYKHAEEKHEVSINEIIYNFSSKEEYEDWKKQEKLEVRYTLCRKIRNKSKGTEIHYACNKSNTKGYQSNYKRRTEKSGGSIKINGFCPSRLIINDNEKGEIIVRYQKTHLGHNENELRSQHLSNMEKSNIVEKLQLGIPTDRILEDARKLECDSLQRINMLNKNDINYLRTKHNIDKRRHKDQMVAVALKVNEWNAHGQNYAFIFKQEGETHEVLKKEDFALGFMNTTMEDKLRNFCNIICMDGTHCTNNKKMDLTIMLIKDDKNAGFPVAFFLSNRMDQKIQEVFLGALKAKLKEEIRPKYFMTDDDGKYYKAWVKIMNNEPKRLLCTWHVIKNWNIQGRAKIKNLDLKKKMKVDMKRILNETDEEKFLSLVDAYCNKLETANEIDFLNYLKKNYFQQDRMEMWAHCYRKNAGVNTNMSVESLNNFLKNNQLKRRANVTVERLLDVIDELVDFKMWQRILNMERPNANNYQDRIVIKAHKAAELMKNMVEVIQKEEGQYQVKASYGKSFYNISYNELCESACKTLFCRVCKICIHRYRCECYEYVVRNTLCKHVHLVCMHEERVGTKSVLDDVVTALEKESEINTYHQKEITQFIEEKIIDDKDNNNANDEIKRSAEVEDLGYFLKSLNEDEYTKIMGKIKLLRNEVENTKNNNSRKRKMDKQEYYPSKKPHN